MKLCLISVILWIDGSRLARISWLATMSKKNRKRPYPVDAVKAMQDREILEKKEEALVLQRPKRKAFVKPQWAKSKPAPVDAAKSPEEESDLDLWPANKETQEVHIVSDSEDGMVSVDEDRRSSSLETELLRAVGLSKSTDTRETGGKENTGASSSQDPGLTRAHLEKDK